MIAVRTIPAPRNSKVLIQLEKNASTEGGILLPDSAQDAPQTGIVLASGPGRRIDGEIHPIGIEDGSRVIFSRYSGNAIRVDGEDCVLIDEDAIFAVL